MHADFLQLSRYALNEASSAERKQLELHLRGCESCRAQVREIATAERALEQVESQKLESHASCPSALEWARFIENTVTASERDALNRHLLVCDECVERVLTGKRVMQPNIPEYALEQVRQLMPAKPTKVRKESWFFAPLRIPKWMALAFSGAILALLAVVFHGQFNPVQVSPVAMSPQKPDSQQLWDQLAALKPGNGKVTLVAVTPALQQTLSAYQKKPQRKEQYELLDQLHKLEPALPVEQIQSVRLKGGPEQRPGEWIAIQWNGWQLDIVPIVRALDKRQEK